MQPESTRPGFHLWLFGLPTCLGVSPMAVKGCQPVWEFHRWLFRVANLFGSFTDGYLGLPTCLGVSPMAFSGGHPGFSLAYHRLRLRFNVFDNA